MMTNQEFTVWTPVANVPQSLFVEQIVDNYEGLRIILKGKNEEDKALALFFSDYIFYRNTNESYFLRTIDAAPKKRISPLFIIENSNLIKWLHEESYNIYQNEKIVHYLILSGNDCIDILSISQPVVQQAGQ